MYTDILEINKYVASLAEYQILVKFNDCSEYEIIKISSNLASRFKITAEEWLGQSIASLIKLQSPDLGDNKIVVDSNDLNVFINEYSMNNTGENKALKVPISLEDEANKINVDCYMSLANIYNSKGKYVATDIKLHFDSMSFND